MMRVKKAGINSIVSLVTYFIAMIPNFIVRGIFLNKLGNEMLGVNSLYTNIISYLSIVELGIGSAIIFSLYKPYAENNLIKVKGYLKYYKKFYKNVGLIIIILGISVTPFLKIFIKGEINIIEAKLYFILFLINTVISYFFSYKICIINVAQEEYKIALATTFSKLLIAVLQICFLNIYPSFYLYLIIQIIVNLLYYLFINMYINIKYNWIRNLSDGAIEEVERKKLTLNVKSLFFHKIGSLFVTSTDNMVIAAFVNLKVVGIYNSYNMIIMAFQSAIGNALSGVTATIGEFLVKKDNSEAYNLHKKFFFLNFWIVSLITICLYNTLKQFVFLWLGSSQKLDEFTLNIILINFYFSLMRVSVEKFKDAAGLYYEDRYAALFEAIINFIMSIVLVNLIGLPGVFLGTLISNFTVVFWIKPKITYKYIFKKPVFNYFKMYIKYLLISIIMLFLTSFIVRDIKQIYTFKGFFTNCIINVFLINIVYIVIFWNNDEFKYYKKICLNIISGRINKRERIIIDGTKKLY